MSECVSVWCGAYVQDRWRHVLYLKSVLISIIPFFYRLPRQQFFLQRGQKKKKLTTVWNGIERGATGIHTRTPRMIFIYLNKWPETFEIINFHEFFFLLSLCEGQTKQHCQIEKGTTNRWRPEKCRRKKNRSEKKTKREENWIDDDENEWTECEFPDDANGDHSNKLTHWNCLHATIETEIEPENSFKSGSSRRRATSSVRDFVKFRNKSRNWKAKGFRCRRRWSSIFSFLCIK